jgi:hypothetical protein
MIVDGHSNEDFGVDLINRNAEFNDLATNPLIQEEEEEEDIFAGDYEEYHEKSFYADFDSTTESPFPPLEDLSSFLKPKRTQLFKIVITRQKREFESPFNFQDKISGEEGTIQTFEIKPKAPTEYQMIERPYLEIGLQTYNDSVEKSYQVAKMRMNNSYTQVEKGMSDVIQDFQKIGNSYINNNNKVIEIENFLNNVRSRMEQSLQSNETIDIFQNDFDLDRNTQIKTDEKKEKKVELRTFKDDNYLAGSKNKKDKSINYIRFLSPEGVYMAHSIIRNLSSEERIKVIGIPYTSQLLFWNFINREINSPIFVLDIPNEITAFEFCPTNLNKLVCAMYSGQIIIFEFKDLLGLLNKSSDGDNNTHKKVDKKYLYEFYITQVIDSHKTHITSMKWFPKNVQLLKYNFITKETNEVQLLATIGEDGIVLVWDFKRLPDPSKNDGIPFILRPVHKVEVYKMDSIYFFKLF